MGLGLAGPQPSFHHRLKGISMKALKRIAIIPLILAIAGCAGFGPSAGSGAAYYKVTDVSSGKAFYTQKVTRSGAAVTFKDEKTGGETVLQNSQVLQIQKEAYTAGLAAPAAPAAAAAAAPAAVAPAAVAPAAVAPAAPAAPAAAAAPAAVAPAAVAPAAPAVAAVPVAAPAAPVAAPLTAAPIPATPAPAVQ